MDQRRGLLVVATVYVAVMAAYTYGFANPSRGSDAMRVVMFVALGALHFATGFAAGSWFAIPLPVLAVLLAVPAGFPENVGGEPFPVWLGLALLVMVPGALLIAVGLTTRFLLERRRTSRTA